MRILFITHYARFYGANRSLLQLILELRAKYGVKSLVLVRGEGEFQKELKDHDIPYLTHRFYNWLNPKGHIFKDFLKRICNMYFFHFLIKKLKYQGKFDLIHTNSSATQVGGVISKKLGIKHIWHIREYGDKDYDLSFYCGKKAACKFMNKHATRIIAISYDLREHYAKHIEVGKIKVIYNGVLPPLKIKRKNNTNTPLRLSFVGIVSETKNQLEAIKACEYLIRQKNNDFELTIVGEGEGDYLDKLENYVIVNKLDSHVKFIGYLSNVNDHLENMDIGIVCSKSEAFGRVTVEYMMHNMPVIASNSGANSELIEQGKSGCLYNYGNFKELAECIKMFISDREKVKEMGVYGRTLAKKKFSSSKNSDEIYSLYQSVLSKRN